MRNSSQTVKLRGTSNWHCMMGINQSCTRLPKVHFDNFQGCLKGLGHPILGNFVKFCQL